MAKVYVSSTVADLQAERRAVIDGLVQARHQPVHSYLPDSETVRDSCLADVDGCDLYVLILGHRYGFIPETNNPERLSITHLEFRRADRKPRLALQRTSVPDIALSDLRDPERSSRVWDFHAEVNKALRAAQFADEADLIAALSAGIQQQLEKLNTATVAPNDPAVLAIITTLTRQVDAKDAENQALRQENQQLKDQLAAAIARTLTAAIQPDASPATVEAAEALREGDAQPAEALLRKEEDRAVLEVAAAPDASEDETAARRRAAELAREQGALAFAVDVRAALAAYQRAAEHEPRDIWTHISIGDLYVALGDLAAGRRSFDKAHLAAAERLETDADDENAQHDLAVSHERIGDVLSAQGDLDSALAAYQARHTIAEALAARDPANTEWQRDLSVSHDRIGDVRVAQGDLDGALAAYSQSLAIAEALAARDPANTEWQRDLSVSHDRIGSVRVAQGDLDGALAAYTQSLAIREALAARDPANVQWQIDVAVSCSKLGMHAALSEAERRAHLARGLDILTGLKSSGRLPPNQDWTDWFGRALGELARQDG